MSALRGRSGLAGILLVCGSFLGGAASAATTAQSTAEALWKTRAALNVAALQCQYDPSLNAVSNYNQFIKTHKSSLDDARSTVEGSYRKKFGKAWAGQFDRYNTRLYNGFSATMAQVAFCGKMSEIGAAALTTAPDQLGALAVARIPEIEGLFPKAEPAPAKKPAVAAKKKKKKKSKPKK